MGTSTGWNIFAFGYVYASLLRFCVRSINLVQIHKPHSLSMHRYEINTFSQPATPLAVVTYALVRHFQRQFARDSVARMQQLVTKGAAKT